MSSFPTDTAPFPSRARQLLRATGIAIALLGILGMLGWHLHWTPLLQVAPRAASTKYNTALAFLCCGAAAIALTSRCLRWATVLGALTLLIGTSTLLEYVLNLNLGIDELFVKDYLLDATVVPGRMSPLTASCFTITGLGLAIAGMGLTSRHLRILALSATAVMLIAGSVGVAYLLRIDTAFGWGAYTRMAPQTAAAFVVLSLGVLTWAWRTGRTQGIDLVRWVPATASVTVMGVVALGSSISQAQLESAVGLGKHTYEVILCAQALLTNVQDSLRGARRYAISDQADQLATFKVNSARVPQTLATLAELTRDNPTQQNRLKSLSIEVEAALDYARNLIETYDSVGPAGVKRLEATNISWQVSDRVRTSILAFTDTERELLKDRNSAAEQNFRHTSRLTMLGTLLATVCLAFAHWLTNRELRRRQRADARLAESLNLQSEILDSAPYGIVSSTREGLIRSINPAAERLLGYRASELIGHATPALWHEPSELEERQREVAARLGREIKPTIVSFLSTARPGQPDEREWTFIRRDGSRFRGSLIVTALTDTEGRVSGYLGMMHDVTERVRQQTELRLSEDRFRRAFDDAPIGMALVSLSGRWLKVNRALCEMVGHSSADLLASDLQQLTLPEDRYSLTQHLREAALGDGNARAFEKRWQHRAGNVITVRSSFSVARDPEGAPLYLIAQVEDVTERRQMEQLKSAFIATVSHELRTPLTSIRGALGLLVSGALGTLSEKMAGLLKIAHQNSERLVRIINDILDIEKIEAGRLELRLERLSLRAILQQAVEANLAYADKYQVQLRLEPLSGEDAITADSDRLIQVLSNLISNAVKFSAAGNEVRVRAHGAGAFMRVEVQDTGTGIPEAFRPRIFEKFAQADGSNARRFDGTGLGLSITRELVQSMGGSIGFESTTGVGTTFYFLLPRAAPATVDGLLPADALLQAPFPEVET